MVLQNPPIIYTHSENARRGESYSSNQELLHILVFWVIATCMIVSGYSCCSGQFIMIVEAVYIPETVVHGAITPPQKPQILYSGTSANEDNSFRNHIR